VRPRWPDVTADFDTRPPQDIEAEQAVLGGCMLSGAAFLDARRVLSDDDWYRPAHSMIWHAILELRARGVAVDAVTVAAELVRQGLIGRAGGHAYLHSLVAGVPTATNVGYYAEIVAEKAVLRRLAEAGARIRQLAYEAANGAGFDGTVADVLERAGAEMLAVRPVEAGDDRPELDVHDLLALPFEDDWVIPGLMQSWERLILTGGEGLGKSVCARQMLVCGSAGLHPFTQVEIEPVKGLALDYENPRRLSRDKYASLVRAADESGRPVGRGMLEIVNEPQGANFLRRGEVDRVLRIVDRVKPRLIYVGPLYRVHEGDPSKEEEARQISAVLDRIREVSGAALITEHHSGHGSGDGKARALRPVGSSVWLRWPEYGYGLALEEGSDLSARAVRFVPWRGPRDERAWPEHMISGYAIGQPWPWVQVDRRAEGLVRPELPDEPDWSQEY